MWIYALACGGMRCGGQHTVNTHVNPTLGDVITTLGAHGHQQHGKLTWLAEGIHPSLGPTTLARRPPGATCAPLARVHALRSPPPPSAPAAASPVSPGAAPPGWLHPYWAASWLPLPPPGRPPPPPLPRPCRC